MEKYYFTFELPKGSQGRNSHTVGIFFVLLAVVGTLAICGSLII